MKPLKVLDGVFMVSRYAVAILMVVLGIATMLTTVSATGGPLDFLFGSTWFIIIFGLYVVYCGVMLLWGGIRNNYKVTSHGLLATFQAFVFASVLMAIQYGFVVSAWAPNAVCAVVIAIIYMRWRFKHNYVDLKHFDREMDKVSKDLIKSKSDKS